MLDIAFIAPDQPPTIVHPRQAPLHLPAVAVTGARPNGPSACGALPTACHRRHGGLDAAPSPLSAAGLAVIGLVRDQLLRPRAWATTPLRDVERRQGRHGQGEVMRACTRHRQPDRQPWAVGHHHDVRALADLGLADTGAPCLAGTTRPSRHARDHSSVLWASSALRSARQTRSQGPSFDHRGQRRQHVPAAP
jgi:hypothetical protein